MDIFGELEERVSLEEDSGPWPPTKTIQRYSDRFSKIERNEEGRESIHLSLPKPCSMTLLTSLSTDQLAFWTTRERSHTQNDLASLKSFIDCEFCSSVKVPRQRSSESEYWGKNIQNMMIMLIDIHCCEIEKKGWGIQGGRSKKVAPKKRAVRAKKSQADPI